jgi:Histidine kinase-like ATPase domain
VSDAGFSLELPPLAEHLGTARSFSAAVARHFGVAGETVEDLKIAISEACIDALVTGERLYVGARENGRTLRFEVSSPDHQGALPERDVLDELGAPARIELIRALFADADVAASDGHRVVRFTVPLP